MNVKLVWVTPNADQMVSHMARVSNPEGQKRGDSAERLISYLIRKRHWSPFQMANICIEVNAPRDISRQILRHTSMHMADMPDFVGVQEFDGVQEFSQRYASVSELPEAELREARLQDTKNRQASIAVDDDALQAWWDMKQENILALTRETYAEALEKGMAKECARVVLPEGLTPSRLYLNGTVRSWLHYFMARSLSEGTQFEHALVADECLAIAKAECPVIMAAFDIYCKDGK